MNTFVCNFKIWQEITDHDSAKEKERDQDANKEGMRRKNAVHDNKVI